jgi:hypothetical protein
VSFDGEKARYLMALPGDKQDFSSWLTALKVGQLSSVQIATLDSMVKSGEAETREQAAERLDWKDTIIDPEEHMYGF